MNHSLDDEIKEIAEDLERKKKDLRALEEVNFPCSISTVFHRFLSTSLFLYTIFIMLYVNLY